MLRLAGLEVFTKKGRVILRRRAVTSDNPTPAQVEVRERFARVKRAQRGRTSPTVISAGRPVQALNAETGNAMRGFRAAAAPQSEKARVREAHEAILTGLGLSRGAVVAVAEELQRVREEAVESSLALGVGAGHT